MTRTTRFTAVTTMFATIAGVGGLFVAATRWLADRMLGLTAATPPDVTTATRQASGTAALLITVSVVAGTMSGLALWKTLARRVGRLSEPEIEELLHPARRRR